ncbi:MAG TPA: GNAT family N-acetyltransferase [Bradyrhizobium sp.]|nr:GNAT family N-acetyltransferase [Bradyrhizobium sp.]
MASVAIRTATADDEGRLLAVITLAFAEDPPCRWLYPDPQQYLENFPKFALGFGGRAFQHGSAYCTDDYLGGALWLPPDVHPDDDALDAVLARSVSESQRKVVLQTFERMASYHPSEPHWHLALIGVDPAQQHRGHGSALMQRGLTPCDRDRKLVYLESTNPNNLPFYERHGFDLLGTIQVGTVPPIFPMLRRPRAQA